MVIATLPHSLADVVGDELGALAGEVFPHHVLDGARSVLLMFCAGFYGRNDGYWVWESGIDDVTGVDVDWERLEVMSNLYPDSWEFIKADCFEYQPGRKFDVVVVDAPTPLTYQAARWLGRWTMFAEQAVVVGVHWKPLVEHGFNPPHGWSVTSLVKRADHRGGTYWLVCEKA